MVKFNVPTIDIKDGIDKVVNKGIVNAKLVFIATSEFATNEVVAVHEKVNDDTEVI